MLDKIVKEAGFRLVREYNLECLLQCVKDLQRERDHYRELVRGLLVPDQSGEEHF